MKKILTLVCVFASMMAAHAQSFDIRYKGASLADGEVINIEGHLDPDWGDEPIWSFDTNPSGADFEGLFVYNTSSSDIKVDAKIEISDNSLVEFGQYPIGDVSWCMGDRCEMVKNITHELNGVTIKAGAKASGQYHVIVPDGRHGAMTTKMTVTSGGVSKSIVIKMSNVEDGINDATQEINAKEVARYTVDGRLLSAPAKGVNIVKMSDGKSVKQLVR